MGESQQVKRSRNSPGIRLNIGRKRDVKELFDDRDVIGISGRVPGDGGGGIHCITQLLPAVTGK